MNTIRINQVLYNDAVVYARKHNMSVAAGSNGFMDINIGAQLRIGK